MMQQGPLPERQGFGGLDWRQGYGVVDTTAKEVITATLWERQLYTSGTTLSIEFFTGPTSGIAGNLDIGGQLPNGNAFLVQAIRIIPAVAPRVTVAAQSTGAAQSPALDVFNLIYNGTASVSVGPKNYGRWPIFMLPSGAGVTGASAISGTYAAGTGGETGFAQSGPADPRSVYSFGIPFVIPPQYNFKVRLEWDTAQTLLGGDTQIFCALDGEQIRPVQ